MQHHEIDDLMQRLPTLDGQAQGAALSQVEVQRAELRSRLELHAEKGSTPFVRAAAMYLMGRHRLDECVPYLLRHIEFDAPHEVPSHREPLWERYPAIEALVHIGKPSVLSTVDMLAEEEDDLRRNLAVRVLRGIEGTDFARQILERRMAEEDDLGRKAKLADAMERLVAFPTITRP